MNRRTLLLVAALLTGGAGAYTVKPGDTLYSIARAGGVRVAELQRLNNLSGTTISVGQVLRLSGEVSPAAPATPRPAAPAPTSPSAVPSTRSTAPGVTQAPLPPRLSAAELAPTPAGTRLNGVSVSAPEKVTMGDAFVLRLSGPRAAEATVRFLSEVGEDVRRPAEVLRPGGAAGEYRVLGRVVLGKTTPVVYEVRLGDEVLRARIPVSPLSQTVQHLNLPSRISGVLQDAGRAAEERAVENAYALRSPQVWTRPFAPGLANRAATSSSFGQPRTYLAGGPVSYHYGTDYPAPTGTPVLAVNDGTVVLAGKYPVRGNLVVIDHGAGLVSLYFHQSRLNVRVGDRVTRGQKIGEVGTTGLSAGPHLHLEMRVRGEATDPADWTNRVWPR
ncbi:LysM peptidoglycan-binding domain-containing M23 family metallopeptidase [Deinococcus sp. Leaf326]|uniref:LysM peptidoglycan-binding domain-containing M23 family metallopeptidase n=1 Tax=Deinococcus sp. Leaf326 TaxID=1736338 RepID=UPI0006FE86B9|nr:peptidoglycan DD-metalloendopeptidase family protein [Deinococcus sp. Leaf326]KQR40995.1 peptidase M23 [Deinococcus sp. Leaf326]